MKVRGLARFLVVVAVLGCSKKKGEAVAIPPSAPNNLTTPGAGDLEEEELADEEDGEEDVDVDGGFGSSPAPKEPAKKPEAWMHGAAKKIAAHARGKTRAWDRLAEMTDTYGHRLSGSKALEDAIDWTVKTMKADGLANVRREKVMVPKWVRGKESLRVTAPFKRELQMIGLGMSVGTKGKLETEVAVVDHVDKIAKAPKGSLKGKIVLINQVMPPYDRKNHNSHYGPTVKARTSGASLAAKAGAAAVLVRSVTSKSLATPHTGSLSYADGVKKIPAAAVTHEAADTIARAAKRGTVKLALSMGAKLVGDVPSANAIGEIVGARKAGGDRGDRRPHRLLGRRDRSIRRRRRLLDRDGGGPAAAGARAQAQAHDSGGAVHQRGERAARR